MTRDCTTDMTLVRPNLHNLIRFQTREPNSYRNQIWGFRVLDPYHFTVFCERLWGLQILHMGSSGVCGKYTGGTELTQRNWFSPTTVTRSFPTGQPHFRQQLYFFIWKKEKDLFENRSFRTPNDQFVSPNSWVQIDTRERFGVSLLSFLYFFSDMDILVLLPPFTPLTFVLYVDLSLTYSKPT